MIRQVPGLRQCHELADVAVDNADEDDLNDILAARASRRCPANREGESSINSSTSNTGSSASTGASSFSNLDSHDAEENLSDLSSIDDRATSPPRNDQVNPGGNAEDGQLASLPVIATKARGKGKKAARGRGKRR